MNSLSSPFTRTLALFADRIQQVAHYTSSTSRKDSAQSDQILVIN